MSIRSKLKQLTAVGLTGGLLIASLVGCAVPDEPGTRTARPLPPSAAEAAQAYAAQTPPTPGTGFNVVQDFSAAGDGVQDDTPAFAAALAAIGERQETLTVPHGQYVLSGSLTFPRNMTLSMADGATLCLSRETVLDLQCDIKAGAYTIFAGEGTVTGDSPADGYPQWFGDAGHGGDDSAAMQQAVNVCARVLLPATDAGYRLGNIRLNKPVVIQGVGDVRTNILRTPGEHLFVVCTDRVAVTDLYVMGNGAHNSDDAVIFLDTQPRDLRDILIRNVHGIWNGYALKDAESDTHTVGNLRMESCTMTVNFNVTIHTTDLTGGSAFVDVVANNVPNVEPVTYPGWYMENAVDVFMDNIDAAGGLGNGEGGDGFVFVNCARVHIERGMQDYVNGIGLKLVNCTQMDVQNMVCSLYEGYGIYMEHVTDSTFTVVKANGVYPHVHVAETRGTAYEAVYLSGCRGVTLRNLAVQYNQTHGLVLADSTDTAVDGYSFLFNNGDAYLETGSSDANTLRGAVCSDNYKSRPTFTQCGSHSALVGLSINGRNKEPLTGPGTVM